MDYYFHNAFHDQYQLKLNHIVNKMFSYLNIQVNGILCSYIHFRLYKIFIHTKDIDINWEIFYFIYRTLSNPFSNFKIKIFHFYNLYIFIYDFNQLFLPLIFHQHFSNKVDIKIHLYFYHQFFIQNIVLNNRGKIDVCKFQSLKVILKFLNTLNRFHFNLNKKFTLIEN